MGERERAHRLWALLLAAVLMLLSSAAFGHGPTPLIVAISENRPLAFINDDGEAAGFYVDLIEFAADEENWDITYVELPRARALELADEGEIDLIATIGYQDPFIDRFVFTQESLLSNWGTIYVPVDSGIESILDLNGVAIAILEPSTHAIRLRELIDAFNLECQLVEADSFAGAIELVMQGNAQGALLNRLNGHDFSASFPIRATSIVFNPIDVRIAASTLTPAFVIERLDVQLKILKSDPDSLYYQSLSYWLGEHVVVGVPKWLQQLLIAAGILIVFLGLGILYLRTQVRSRTKSLSSTNLQLKAEIAERIQAEDEKLAMEGHLRQSQRLEAVGTLASGVAHEINNPLMGMMNYAELVKKLVQDPKALNYLAEIGNEGNRIARIVRNLLTFSRQDSEAATPSKVGDIVDGSLALVGSLLRKDQIAIELDIPEGLPLIKCRNQQIQQVVINLLTNARDALNERYAEYDTNKMILITARQLVRDDADWIRTTIEDHGTGIREDVQRRIFDPFFTTKSRTEGTGLGLSVSFGIVREHHGLLSVESVLGKYTRFHIDLPVNNR